LLSWRVHILPYIEHDKLHKQFKLDEPWDGPTNIALLNLMPGVYLGVTGKAPAPLTYYRGFSSPGAVFDRRLRLDQPRAEKDRFRRDRFFDPMSETLLIVEAGTPVEWTKPDDLDASPGKPFPKMGGLGWRKVFQAATADYTHLTRHIAHSAAALRYPSARLDAARCGIALYWLSPFGTDPAEDGLEPVLSWTSHIAQTRLLRPGESTGYGRRFVAERDTWIGIVPVGYADGFRRDLTGTQVRVGGEVRRVVGAVSMDMTMIDVTDLPGVQLPPADQQTPVHDVREQAVLGGHGELVGRGPVECRDETLDGGVGGGPAEPLDRQDREHIGRHIENERGEHHGDRHGEAGRLARREPHELFRRRRFLPEGLPPGEARGVREDLAQRDPVLVAAAEVGHELAERHVELELFLAYERQNERGRRELRERCEIEERRFGARAVWTRARIGAERARCVGIGGSASLDAHARRRAGRADGVIEDGLRARDEIRHAKSRSPAPRPKIPGTTAGSEPDGLRSPRSTSAAATRLGSRESYAQRYAEISGMLRMS